MRLHILPASVLLVAVLVCGCAAAQGEAAGTRTKKAIEADVEAPALVNTNIPAYPELTGGFKSPAGMQPDQLKFSPWRSIGAILLVIGGLLAVNSWLRKRRGVAWGRGEEKHITMIERFYVDPKRSILLLEVDGRRVLVGVGADKMDRLMEFEKPETGNLKLETGKEEDTADDTDGADVKTGR